MEIAIKKLRKQKRMSQTDLAESVGVNLRTVGAWERGETIPNALQVWACAVALGTDPNEVLGWYEEHPRASSAPPDGAHRQILDAYDSLSEEGREVAVNVVSGMARTYPQERDEPPLVAQDASA